MKLIEFIVTKRKIILLVTALLALISIMLLPHIKVNYDLSRYLPENSDVSQGISVMESEFGQSGDLTLMINNVNPEEALGLSARLQSGEGIADVSFDPTDKNFYKERSALFLITLKSGNFDRQTASAIDDIRERLDGYDVRFSGTAIDNLSMQDAMSREMPIFSVIAVILISVILLLISSSWIEPLLFLAVSGIAILLNYGSNVFWGEISFVTIDIAALLQLALSIDYSIMLLDQYHRERKTSHKLAAMKTALKNSFTAVFASSLTTIFGLLAMVVMSFTIGADLGVILAKGILINIVVVLFVLPALILALSNLMDRTKKPALHLPVGFFSKFGYKARYIVVIATLILLPLAYFTQSSLDYEYAYHSSNQDVKAIEAAFGSRSQIAVLYDRGAAPDDIIGFAGFVNKQEQVIGLKDYHTSVAVPISSAGLAAAAHLDPSAAQGVFDLYNTAHHQDVDVIPLNALVAFVQTDILPNPSYGALFTEEAKAALEQAADGLRHGEAALVGPNYHRMIIETNLAAESSAAHDFYNQLKEKAGIELKNVHIIGATPLSAEIKDSFGRDRLVITILTILLTVAVIAISFRSFFIPIILVTLIQLAVWTAMCYPAVQGRPIYFLAYIIAQCIQMGATIDYAILLTSHYVKKRATQSKRSAITGALRFSIATIATSASILISATLTIALVSSEGLISSICMVIARGAIVSALAVLLILPAALTALDRFVVRRRSKTQEKKGG